MLFKEPGVSGQDLLLPHISHTATTSYRLDFYKELLDLVDVVISLGGEFGVLRLLMTCEWVGKPIFLLPGAGGSTDYLWNDFFKKFHQVAVLTSDELLQLKRTPYINEEDSRYAEQLYDLIKLVKRAVPKRLAELHGIVAPGNITIGTALSSFKHFSLDLWVLILTIISLITSISYFAGQAHLFK